MAGTYTLSDYLLDRLVEVGCRHIFGVPGDFAFPFLDRVVDCETVTWVGSCNELNAAYSADGYARRTGLGAITGSCGVLEMGAAGGICGAYSEFVPLLVIAGFPAVTAMVAHGITHHSLRGDYSKLGLVMAPMTIAQIMVSAGTGAADIDQAIRTCMMRKGPVHLQFPADLQELAASPPSTPLALDYPASDETQLAEFTEMALALLHGASAPAMLVDYLAARYDLSDLIHQLSDRGGIPFSAPIGGTVGDIDQASPGYLGFYAPTAQQGEANERIDAADALVRICLAEGELNRGSADRHAVGDRFIDLSPVSARVGKTQFPRVAAKDALERLIAGIKRHKGPLPGAPVAPQAFEPVARAQLTQDRIWEAFRSFVEPGDAVAVDYGTIQAVKLMRLPVSGRTLIQNSWEAIGWTTPAMIGDMLADGKGRFIQVIGDGGFHETCQEISTLLAHGLAPITVLINNTTYEVENLTHIDAPCIKAYNDMPNWDYAAFPRVVAPKSNALGIRATTEDEMDDAFRQAAAAQRAGRYTLIELVTAPHDSSTIMKQFNGVDARPPEQRHLRSAQLHHS